jgi:hypothetical protein
MNDSIVHKLVEVGLIYKKYEEEEYVERYFFSNDVSSFKIRVIDEPLRSGIYLTYDVFGEKDENLLLQMDKIMIEEVKKDPKYRLKFVIENYKFLETYKELLIEKEQRNFKDKEESKWTLTYIFATIIITGLSIALLYWIGYRFGFDPDIDFDKLNKLNRLKQGLLFAGPIIIGSIVFTKLANIIYKLADYHVKKGEKINNQKLYKKYGG